MLESEDFWLEIPFGNQRFLAGNGGFLAGNPIGNQEFFAGNSVGKREFYGDFWPKIPFRIENYWQENSIGNGRFLTGNSIGNWGFFWGIFGRKIPLELEDFCLEMGFEIRNF